MTINDESSIYIGGLPYEATDETLREVFATYGHIIAVKIINDRGTRGKCYGFVTFEDPRSAIEAIDHMDGRTIGGRVVRVNGVKTRGERLDFDRKFQQESESSRDWEQGRDQDRRRKRVYNHDRERLHIRSDNDRFIDHDRSRDFDSEQERGYGRVRNHGRERDRLLDRDQDIDLEDDDRKTGRNRNRNWGRDHDLDSDRDGEIDRNNGHGKFVETDRKRKSRKYNGSVTTSGHSREIWFNSNDNHNEQVEDELLRSTQRLEELKKEVMQKEEVLEHTGTRISELQQKSMKLEELLINAKKTSSYRKTQLSKLHKCFLQVKDYTERLKSSEKELQSLVDGVVSEDIGNDALWGVIEGNGNA